MERDRDRRAEAPPKKMDEARLIEIAQRFRALREHIADADMYLARAEAATRYGSNNLAEIQNLRADITRGVDQCMDDLNTMQETIRKATVCR